MWEIKALAMIISFFPSFLLFSVTLFYYSDKNGKHS